MPKYLAILIAACVFSVNAEAAPRTLTPFFRAMAFGDEQIIVSHGALELRARCLRTGSDLAMIVITGGEVYIGDLYLDTGIGASRYWYPYQLSGTTAVASDGAYITVPAGTVGLGLNVLGHDCVISGAYLTGYGAL